MVNVSSTNEQKIKLTAAPVTAAGHPAPLDGALVIEVVSGEGTFSQDPAEPLSFYVISGDNAGVTEYKVTADADTGAGVVSIEESVVYDVTAAQAAGFGFVVSAAEAK